MDYSELTLAIIPEHSLRNLICPSSEEPHTGDSVETVESPVGNSQAKCPAHTTERALVRRVDLRLVPILIVIYLMAFLDRVNIGNAITLGLPAELHLQGNQINIALTIFYVPYIIFEIPSNILLKHYKPHVWLSGCMFAFGLVVTSQGFIHNYSGLLAARFFLGVTEAGVFPGCFYLLSMWYKREEAQRRFTIFFNSVTLAGAFGGLLASVIYKMNGIRNYSGWRWIFILEGLLTMVIGMISYFLITDFPEDSKMLAEDEKIYMKERLLIRSDDNASSSGRSGLVQFFVNYKSYLGASMYFGGVIVGYSLTYFLPTILSQYKYTAISTQLHSVPPFATAWAFSLLISFISDRTQHRLGFVILPLLMALTGVGILLNIDNNVQAQYAAVFLIAMGVFGALPIAVCWYIMNLHGHFERSLGSAWMISFGNVGGIVATFSFLAMDAPYYHLGYSIITFGLCLMAASSIAYAVGLWIENRKAGRQGFITDGQSKYLL